MDAFVRRDGFQRPLHHLQVLGWFVFGFDVAIFCLSVPFLNPVVACIFVPICAVSVVCLVVATAKATKCDPADPHLKAQPQEEPGLPFCVVCNSYVYPTSKHCRSCAKCVHGFDHHCNWLNNCVGKDNYHAFAAAIGSVAVMTGAILICTISLLISLAVDDESETFGIPEEVLWGFSIAMVVVNVPLFALDVQLILFHLFLTSQNLTTHEYVLRKEEKKSGVSLQRCMTCCMDNLVLRRRKKPRAKVDPKSDELPPRCELCESESCAGHSTATKDQSQPVSSVSEISVELRWSQDSSSSREGPQPQQVSDAATVPAPVPAGEIVNVAASGAGS